MSDVLLGRMAIKACQIKPGEAEAVEIDTGQLLQIVDVQGRQVADFVAFNRDDPAESLSPAATRSGNKSIMLQVGMKLYSNKRQPMFTIIADDVGRHDLLYPACDPERYQQDYGMDEHANCRDALTEAAAAYDIAPSLVRDPINWFMNVSIRQRGELEIREPLSERNDSIVLEATMNAIAIVSACPQDQNSTNGGTPTDVLIRVYR